MDFRNIYHDLLEKLTSVYRLQGSGTKFPYIGAGKSASVDSVSHTMYQTYCGDFSIYLFYCLFVQTERIVGCIAIFPV